MRIKLGRCLGLSRKTDKMAKFRADKNCKIWAFWDQAFKGTFRGPKVGDSSHGAVSPYFSKSDSDHHAKVTARDVCRTSWFLADSEELSQWLVTRLVLCGRLDYLGWWCSLLEALPQEHSRASFKHPSVRFSEEKKRITTKICFTFTNKRFPSLRSWSLQSSWRPFYTPRNRIYDPQSSFISSIQCKSQEIIILRHNCPVSFVLFDCRHLLKEISPFFLDLLLDILILKLDICSSTSLRVGVILIKMMLYSGPTEVCIDFNWLR